MAPEDAGKPRCADGEVKGELPLRIGGNHLTKGRQAGGRGGSVAIVPPAFGGEEAIKRAIALKLGDLIESAHLTKSEAAGRMKTSRAAVDRLLDPNNTSVTLLTLNRAARALGRRLKVDLVRA